MTFHGSKIRFVFDRLLEFADLLRDQASTMNFMHPRGALTS